MSEDLNDDEKDNLRDNAEVVARLNALVDYELVGYERQVVLGGLAAIRRFGDWKDSRELALCLVEVRHGVRETIWGEDGPDDFEDIWERIENLLKNADLLPGDVAALHGHANALVEFEDWQDRREEALGALEEKYDVGGEEEGAPAADGAVPAGGDPEP